MDKKINTMWSIFFVIVLLDFDLAMKEQAESGESPMNSNQEINQAAELPPDSNKTNEAKINVSVSETQRKNASKTVSKKEICILQLYLKIDQTRQLVSSSGTRDLASKRPGGARSTLTDRDQRSSVFLNDPKNTLPLAEDFPKSKALKIPL